MSLYVQLSRVRSLNGLSVLRPFNPEELRTPIPQHLKYELQWEEEMNEITMQLFQ